MTTSDKGIRR